MISKINMDNLLKLNQNQSWGQALILFFGNRPMTCPRDSCHDKHRLMFHKLLAVPDIHSATQLTTGAAQEVV